MYIHVVGTSSCVILRDLILQLMKLLKKLEFIIIPVANPDGYHVSQTLLNKYTEKNTTCQNYISMALFPQLDYLG